MPSEVLTGEWTLSAEKRQEQMQAAIDTGFPFIEKAVQSYPACKPAIVGFGPSLMDTWNILVARQSMRTPIFATSGAYDFLREHGNDPDYYIVIDPRKSAVELLGKPDELTTFYMASCVHPSWWKKLEGFDVKLWHLIDGPGTVPWVKKNHPAGIDSCIGGGSTVGQRAMNVAAAMGYRRFDVFGMDGSFENERHAGPHNSERQPIIEASYANGPIRKTTPQLRQSVVEMRDFLLTADAEVTFYGEGLMQDMARTIQKGKK